MKEGRAAECDLQTQFVLDGENEVRRRVADAEGNCALAVAGGVPLADLGPDTCPAAGARCDERVGAIINLDALAECINCTQEGLESAFRLHADFPADVTDSNERKCIRSVVSRSLKAIRAGIRDVDNCADGGQSPFACPVDDDAATKFGAALERIDAATAKCRDTAGTLGALSGDSARLCHHTAATPSDLARCAGAMSRCLVCSHANGVYRQSQDCTAFAGIPCHGTSATPWRLFVANEGSDSVTYFNDEAAPLFGSIGESSFAVGDAPIALATNRELNLVYALNSGDGTVTMLDAITGVPIYGTHGNSSFPAGVDPVSIAVDMREDILYVADRAADSVLLLNALDGRPYYGTVPASTVAVGDEPVALMHSDEDQIVYVANYASDSLTLLDAATGGYRNSTLAASTVPTGDGPIALSDPDTVYFDDVLHVVNHLDSTVTLLDSGTGAPLYGTIPASSRAVGPGPRTVTIGPNYFTSERLLYVTSDDQTTTVLKASSGRYVQRTQPNATFTLDAAPSAAAFNYETNTVYLAYPETDTIVTLDTPDDVHPSSVTIGFSCFGIGVAVDAADNRLYAACDDRITVLDATTGAYAFGNEANSTFPIDNQSGDELRIALDAESDILYVGAVSELDSTQQIFFMDGLTGAQLLPSPLSFENHNGWNLAVNPSLNLLYAMDRDVGLLLIDATTGEVLSSLDQDAKGALLVDEAGGRLYAAGGYDNSFVQFLDSADGSPLFGTVPASTFETERFANALALDLASNRLYVSNFYDNSVTMLDATTGAHAFGNLANSTFATGSYPDSTFGLDVDASTSRLFVHTDGITILDSQTGLPKYGSLDESKLDSLYSYSAGGSVIVNPAANRMYVETVGRVTYYDLSTGAFISSSLPRTPVAAGDAPSAIAVMED